MDVRIEEVCERFDTLLAQLDFSIVEKVVQSIRPAPRSSGAVIEMVPDLTPLLEEEQRLKDECASLEQAIATCQVEIESTQVAISLLDSTSQIQPHEDTLKLRIARGLGITLMDSANKAHVVSQTHNQVQTVDFTEAHSDFHYANLLWDLCS